MGTGGEREPSTGKGTKTRKTTIWWERSQSGAERPEGGTEKKKELKGADILNGCAIITVFVTTKGGGSYGRAGQLNHSIGGRKKKQR